jgi:hypothetical protein
METLTVVIPVYDDYVRWLDGCVASVWAQRDETALRVLVVDNASSQPLPELPEGVHVERTPPSCIAPPTAAIASIRSRSRAARPSARR